MADSACVKSVLGLYSMMMIMTQTINSLNCLPSLKITRTIPIFRDNKNIIVKIIYLFFNFKYLIVQFLTKEFKKNSKEITRSLVFL